MATGGPRVRSLFDRASEADSLAGVIFQGVGAVLLAIGTAIASGILSVADVIIIPLQSLAAAAGDLIDAIFGGSAFIIETGARVTGLSFTGMFNLGPFTFALAIGSVLLGLFVVNAYVSEEPTGNFVPGIPFDIPTPGFTGPEEDDDTG
jgi:hypothetical protein